MSNLPLVSVLMCSYNAGEYITHTITSIVKQSYTNFELLILDNNSSDSTVSMIESFADKRITLVKSKINIGPYGGLNKLLAQAKGDYIAIQDHDDLWHPQKLEKQISFLEKNHKYIGCGTKTLMRYESDQKGFEYYLGEENYYTIHPSLVFRNKKIHRYPNTVYMADALFQKQVLCQGKKCIYNINETLTMHRINSGAKNYSYKRYKFNRQTLKNIFSLHPISYAILAIVFELIRKCMYPVLHITKTGYLIDRVERLPFILQGYKIREYSKNDIKKQFILSG